MLLYGSGVGVAARQVIVTAVDHVSATGLLAYIGSTAGLIASVGTLIAAFRKRDPQILIVRSEEEAEELLKSRPPTKRRRRRVAPRRPRPTPKEEPHE